MYFLYLLCSTHGKKIVSKNTFLVATSELNICPIYIRNPLTQSNFTGPGRKFVQLEANPKPYYSTYWNKNLEEQHKCEIKRRITSQNIEYRNQVIIICWKICRFFGGNILYNRRLKCKDSGLLAVNNTLLVVGQWTEIICFPYKQIYTWGVLLSP